MNRAQIKDCQILFLNAALVLRSRRQIYQNRSVFFDLSDKITLQIGGNQHRQMSECEIAMFEAILWRKS